MMPIIFLAMLWAGWCILHSALISPAVIGFWQGRLGRGFRFYRLLYNGFAIGTLIPVWLYGESLANAAVLVRWEGWQRIPQVLMLAGAVAFFVAGARRYDGLQFLGLRQPRESSTCLGLTDSCGFDSGGVLAMVRHPWYAGSFLILWARNMTAADLVANVVLSVYLVIGTRLEERKLVAAFGDAYRQYRKGVSMFFPFKWVRAQIRKGH